MSHRAGETARMGPHGRGDIEKEVAMAMSQAHKDALAEGRRQSRAIKQYLEALGSRRPGRPVTPDSIRARIARIDEKLANENDPLKRVDLHQAKLDAQAALHNAESAADIEALEAGFIANAGPYSARKGISYAAWREVGVPATVLKKAGIGRGG
ncbi:MAG: hypothetical protein QNJ88_07290 [Acidimicrobiia bacterium]|nr:hypothetical protein [Acidimicrobiia bacterium]